MFVMHFCTLYTDSVSSSEFSCSEQDTSHILTFLASSVLHHIRLSAAGDVIWGTAYQLAPPPPSRSAASPTHGGHPEKPTSRALLPATSRGCPRAHGPRRGRHPRATARGGGGDALAVPHPCPPPPHRVRSIEPRPVCDVLADPNLGQSEAPAALVYDWERARLTQATTSVLEEADGYIGCAFDG